MRQRKPVIEKNRAIEDLHLVRLMALLQELVRDHGRKRAAAILGVDRRTLDAGLDERVLSRRMRTALDRALRSGVGSAQPVNGTTMTTGGAAERHRGSGRGAGGKCEQGAGSRPGRREGTQGRTRAVRAPGRSPEELRSRGPKTGSPAGVVRLGEISPTW